jgi:Flp pilus assembly pilin Flp
MGGRFIPKTSLMRRWQRNRRRSGQTLTEYALIMAYISVVAIQAMDNIAISATESLIDVNCGLIIAQVRNPNLSDTENSVIEYDAVLSYLAAYNYGNFSDADKAKIFQSCYSHMVQTIYASS